MLRTCGEHFAGGFGGGFKGGFKGGFTRTFMSRAQEKKQKNVDQHRRQVDFQVRDRVWLSAKN